MNTNHLFNLCNHFGLGTTIRSPKRVYGGLLHLMWHIDTDKGAYAIKQLSRDINLTDEGIINNYDLTEQITSRFIQQGIPAVCSLEKSGKHLRLIDNTGFLVYPWVDAGALDKDTVSENHALQIPAILAKIHLINLDVPEIAQPKFDIHSRNKLIKLIDKSESFDCSFANDLRKNQNDILAANDAYQNMISVLKNHIVISHGDLDQKNVLWDENNNPILIDWESTRKINPTYEIVNACLDWSGITTNFNKELFAKMIAAYQKAGGIIDKPAFEASFYGVLGNWLNWMVYNMERSCNREESEQKNIGINQVKQVLLTISRLQRIIPELIRIGTI